MLLVGVIKGDDRRRRQKKTTFFKCLHISAIESSCFIQGYETCLGHILDECGTCLGHVWYIFGTCLGHVWDMFGTCLEHVWAIFGTSLGHLWDMFGTCWGHVWDMCGMHYTRLRWNDNLKLDIKHTSHTTCKCESQANLNVKHLFFPALSKGCRFWAKMHIFAFLDIWKNFCLK